MWKRFASSHMQLNLDDSFVNEQVIANSAGSGAGVSIVVSCGQKTGEGAFRWEKNWKMIIQRKRLFSMLCMHWYHSSWTRNANGLHVFVKCQNSLFRSVKLHSFLEQSGAGVQVRVLNYFWKWGYLKYSANWTTLYRSLIRVVPNPILTVLRWCRNGVLL